ncbi:LRR receptor-like serine/threonine-protein kinase RGI3 isoform X2 [Gossypium raimondii]|uniref:non-specific serine/threonine protein kinase n=1 Tax=Gossypium raimondii TaxID=29730 RepID=A0A0D2R3M0_GOSRA|nr:LRR receptor-like serine/threonine-protein kinase RGI3 isoform X2 [Gossypium raimondii]KJB13955.1 hypothetical protein B456_002G103300 [Gossypium raimondii]
MPATPRNLLLSSNIFSFTLLLSINTLLFYRCYSIDEQGQALLTWKNSLNSSGDALKSWSSLDATPCRWFGIHCNSQGEVVEIRLKAIELQGSLPSNLQSLKSLKTLVLSSTNLTGTIPKELGDQYEISYVDLSGNSLTGEIPLEICRLSKLETLSLNSNFLEGEVPSGIGNLSSLVYLTLYDNQLSGEIPKSIGDLRKLQVFRAGGNKNLKGELPWEIGNCTSLVMLGLAETSISGSLPSSLGMLKRIQTIAIYTSLISGPIPEEIGNCSELQNLYLYQNSISGPIPSQVGQLSKLQGLLLWQNNLVGSIPDELGSCTELTMVDLSDNHLTGSIPRSIGKLLKLQELQLSVNQLSGTIPSEIGKLKGLNFVDLSNNRLVGGIPPSINGIQNLEFLDLHSNGITGSLPDSLPTSLQYMDISDNRLIGPLTHGIGSLTQLTKLNLGRNQLSGRIPSEILACSKLQLLNLGDNGFFGEIPKELGQIPALEISLNLSCNQFSGEIPSEFSGLTKLAVLDLSHNKFSGKLDNLASLQNLVSLNVSFNDFSGELPNSPFFRKLPLSDLESNKDLYISNGVVTSADIEHSRHVRPAVKLAMSILISGSAVLVLLAIYMLVRARFANNGLMEDDNWEVTLYQKLDLSIDDIVHNLTSANVIGTGSSGVVYRVIIPNGETLAVKKMWSSEESGAFTSEIETLGSIRHRNIVRLLGWGSNRNLKLLFYNYLPNGSLSSLLHGAGKGGAEWEARYDVVLGVAHALAYLHHDCVPAILHGDVKAMNVLLGAGYEPFLADFGLARVIKSNEDDKFSKLSPRPHLAGSYGYMAPEHATMQRITEKSDVYSFGVVLLEVLTGRHPLDPTLPGGAHLVQWVRDHLANKRNPSDILDPKLRGRADPAMHEMLQTLAVSCLCVSARADGRPTMKDVVAMLKEIHHVETSRDISKGTSTAPQPQSPQPPTRTVVSRGSSNCSFAFSDDSIQSSGGGFNL